MSGRMLSPWLTTRVQFVLAAIFVVLLISFTLADAATRVATVNPSRA